MPMNLYSLKNISHSYPEAPSVKSLDDVSLEISKGEFIALIGAVGSGKSTLLKLLVGLLKPAGGKMVFDGKPMPYKGAAVRMLRKRIGIAFQFPDNQIFEATVRDETAFGLKNYDFPEHEIDERVRQVLDSVGLSYSKFAETSPFELSGGERKRLALASIIVLEPEMLLLDEPTSGVDTDGKGLLAASLADLKKAGSGSIIVTHDLDFAAELCERVIVLQNGRLVYDGGREIYYETDLLRQFGLDPPELTSIWQQLQGEKKVSPDNVFSLNEAIGLLRQTAKKK